MVMDQSRAMSATLPSKWNGDAFEAAVMRCPDYRSVGRASARGIDTEHLLVALLEEQDDAIEDVLAGLDVAASGRVRKATGRERGGVRSDIN
jgi:hypothetical protein